MLLINKELEQTKLFATVTEKTKVTNPVYTLVLQSEYTNKTYTFVLPANTSNHKHRYDLFILDSSLFQELESGRYLYEIQEATDGVVEKGVVKLVDRAQLAVPSLYAYTTLEPSADDFVVYNPE